MLKSLTLTLACLIAVPVFAQNAALGPAPYLPEEARDYGAVEAKPAMTPIAVDISDRAAVVAFYEDIYKQGVNLDAEWNGNIQDCIAGTTNASFRDQTLLRLNYFRAMVGLPSVLTIDDTRNAKCQDAALMMIANQTLSHSPPSSWTCYTDDGREAASNSNISIGVYGPEVIDAYVEDYGTGNEVVGHRRWALYPPLVKIGTGDTDVKNGNFYGSNSLWVLGDFGAIPETPEWVSWPPPGNVPYDLVYPRWSFSYRRADFGSASISMTGPDGPVNFQVFNIRNGYGDNTIVWEVQDALPDQPEQDVVYSVSVQNVGTDAGTQDFSYQVTVIDPDRTPPTPTPIVFPTVTPTETPQPAGPADTNRDGKTDFLDLFTFAPGWADDSGASSYNPYCDIDGDDQVGPSDILQFLTER